MTVLKDSATQYITLKKQGSPPSGTPATDEMFLFSDEATIKLKLDTAATIDLLTSTNGAPAGATYITQTANSTLSAEQALSSLATGLVKVTTGTGVLSTAVGGTDYANASHVHAAGDITSGTLVHERGGLEADVSAYDGLIKIVAGATSNFKCNFAASAAPATSDDTGDGYVIGSLWLDTTNDRAYIALDVTTNAAVWREISNVPDCARVYNSSAITISNATWTALTFDSERYDRGGLHSTASNTSRLTAAVDGNYRIEGFIYWDSNVTASRDISIRLNGTNWVAVHTDAAVSGGQRQAISVTVPMAAADYAELVVQQNSGGNLNISVNAQNSPEFFMTWDGVKST